MSRRGRRKLEEQTRRGRRTARRRRAWLALGLFVCLLALAAVYLLPRLAAREPVARVQAPVVDVVPEPPRTERAKADASPPDSAKTERARSERARSERAGSGPVAAERPASGRGEVGRRAFDAAALRREFEGIAAGYPATYGIMVFDPSSEKTVAMNRDTTFSAASVGKLPVLLALYKSAARGEVDLDDPITMKASDVRAYGTGVLFTYPVGHTITLRECAKLLIKESDNTAWKMLTRYMGRDYVQAELYNIGADSTEYWSPNTTTPSDVLLMLEKISDPSYTSPKLSDEMLDHMTNTSFEDRLPEHLPEDARVAHKIGYYGDTFSDAGVVFPEGPRRNRDPYFIVVMATGTTEGTSRYATQEMSLVTYEAITGTSKGARPGRGPSDTDN